MFTKVEGNFEFLLSETLQSKETLFLSWLVPSQDSCIFVPKRDKTKTPQWVREWKRKTKTKNKNIHYIYLSCSFSLFSTPTTPHSQLSAHTDWIERCRDKTVRNSAHNCRDKTERISALAIGATEWKHVFTCTENKQFIHYFRRKCTEHKQNM